MRVSDALDGALSTLVRRPAAILPIYLVGQSAGTVARALPLLGLFVAYLLLLSGGRLAALEEAIREAQAAEVPEDPEAIGPETAPVAELETAMVNLITPGTVAAVGLSILAGLIVYIVVGAAIHAGQIHTVYAALRERPPVVAGVSGAIRDAWAFVGLRLLEYGLYVLVTAIYGLVVFVAAAIYAADEGIGLFVAAGAALLAPVWLLAVLAIAAVFVFAPQSVVVDERGTIGGLRGGAGFIRRRPGAFAVYLVIALGISGAVAAVGGALAIVGGRQLVGVLTLLAVTPFLHLLKTGIYVEDGGIDPDPLGAAVTRGDRSALDRVREGWRTSLSALWGFTKRTPGLSALSLALFGAGTVGGYYATTGLAVDMAPAGDPAAIFGPLPVGTFVMIAANNWLVAVGQSYAGLALGVPTAVNLLFNGAIVGIVSGLSADLVAVAALVVPHALIEVPALVISGALGFHLALVGWRRFQGRIDDAAVARELRTAFWVLVGLAAVFVIAAFVEAFLTPWIASMIL